MWSLGEVVNRYAVRLCELLLVGARTHLRNATTVDDVDFLGGVSVFPAERVSDSDQDSIGVLVNFRF